MTRDEFEERYGSVADEGFTPEELGIPRRRRPYAADDDEEPPPRRCIWCGEYCAEDQEYCSTGCAIEAEHD